MKKNILLVLFILVVLHGFSQSQTTISGRVFDHSTNLPLPFTTITVHRGDQVVGGAITGNDGRFVIAGIGRGELTVKCSFIGFETNEIPVLLGELNNIINLGRIVMTPSNQNIGEVTVEAKREILSSGLDKKTFDVGENIAQSGGSALDVMKTMPGITVDQEGKVLLRGSDKVMILIDGQQSSLTGFGNQKGLESIPASNIANIEIINNPSAKYDATGMAGIINIVHKKEKRNGWNGDFGFATGIGTLARRKADLPNDLGSYAMNPKLIPSLSLNYKTDKIRFYLMPEAMFLKHLPNNEFTTRTYGDGTATISQVPENRHQQHYIVNGGLDWYIDAKNTLTVSGIYDWESHIDTAQVPYIDMNTMKRYRIWHWREHEITGYMNYSLNFNHRFAEPGHEINARVQYTKGWEDESYFLNDSSSIRQGKDATHILAIEHTTNITLDYVKPTLNGRVEAGIKFQWRRIPVEYTVEKGSNTIIYPGLGDWSDWGEDISAAYANYVYEKPRLNIEGGIRIENTSVFYTIAPENIYYPKNDKYNYFEVYPNVRLTFKLNQMNNLSLFYNRRVDRPGEPELRIFPKYDDPELLKVGNPYLRPQFTQSFEMAYKLRWESGSVFLSGYRRNIKDAYQRIYSIDNSNSHYSIVNKIYQNTGSSTNTGVELIFSQQLATFWKFSGSINGYKNHIDGFNGTLYFPYERAFQFETVNDNTWDTKINNQFSLPEGFQIQLTGVYYAPKSIPQGRQFARSSVDLGVKKGILKGKGELTFSFSDIFNTNGLKQEFDGGNFNVLYENYYETQVVRLGIKYKL